MTHHHLQTRYGPWAIITGASSGIGREIAIKLAEAGLNLVLVARSQTTLGQLAVELHNQHGIEAQVIAVDLAQESGIAKVEEQTRNLDCGLLVAAAGFGTSGRFLDANLDDEMTMLDVNCRALMRLSLVFGRRFVERGSGGLILVSSIIGFHGIPNVAHYSATKAYVQALAEALNVEFSPLGVDVLASAPGPTNSGFATRADMQMGSAMDPATVAQATLKALGRKGTVLPGFLSKAIVYSQSMLPRWARIRLMGQIMGTMTNHQQAHSVIRQNVKEG
ncbi:MAG: SDR family oxidoreductase [Chloroflexota bacterium]